MESQLGVKQNQMSEVCQALLFKKIPEAWV